MAFLDETGLAHFWNQILARLNKFVPAETGKGLSTNDYTTEEKTKLAGIEAGANKITVDSALSSTSTNPVQNNTINTKFDSIQTDIDNKVPNTRTVNGKALSGDITLSASDVGAVSYDTAQTLTDAQKAQARENIDSDNIYVVQLEYDGNNYILSANTPYADMKAAYEANKTLYCRVFMNNGNLILPLIRYEPSNDWWLFGIIATNQSYTIGITSDRTIGISADLVTTADLPTISTTLSSSSTNSEVPSAKCVYDELQKRNLKQATSDTLGGVKADPATESDTQPVRIGNDGKLVTAAGKPDISLGLTSASVGQTIKVKAIDESGKPTAWEADDGKYLKLAGGDMSGKLTAPKIETGSGDTNYFQSRKFRGEGDAATYYHAIDFGYANHDRVDFHEYGGIWNFFKNTSGKANGGSLCGKITTNGWEGNAKLTGSPTAPTPGTSDNSTRIATTAFVNSFNSTKLESNGDGSNVTAAFTAASTRANIATGEKLSVLFGKIAKWLADLGSLAFKSTVAKSDLAAAVQTSLGKADTALQEHQSLAAYRTAAEQNIIDNGKQDKITSTNKLAYSLISGTPTIPTVPTNLSAFTNDEGYLTLATLPKYEGVVE